MKKVEKKLQNLSEKEIKKSLLSFVMGGSDLDRCDGAGAKYADSIYVKKPEPVVIQQPKPIGK